MDEKLISSYTCSKYKEKLIISKNLSSTAYLAEDSQKCKITQCLVSTIMYKILNLSAYLLIAMHF
jgi:hypothetical protein